MVRSVGSTLFYSADVLKIFKKLHSMLLSDEDSKQQLLAISHFIDTVVNLDVLQYFDINTEIYPLLQLVMVRCQ
jgi:hypothetical protein